jgi:hypothetical protein
MAPARIGNLDQVFASIISIALTVIALIAIAMLVVGGYKFLLAGADKDAVSKARNTLTYAVAGLILAVSAWMILRLLGNFLGINVANFTICLPGQAC